MYTVYYWLSRYGEGIDDMWFIDGKNTFIVYGIDKNN